MIDLTRALIITAAAFTLSTTGCDNNDASDVPTSDETRSEAADDKHHDSTRTISNTVEISGSVLSLSINGHAEPNAKLNMEIGHVSGPKPSTIRAWYGPKSGEGALKSKAGGHDDHWHCDVECPGTITSQDGLWIEIEDSDGNRDARKVTIK